MVRGLLDGPRDVLVTGRPTAQRQTPRGGGRPLLQTLTAAAKEKQPETHDAPQLNRGVLGAGVRISMRDHGEERDKKCRIPLHGGPRGGVTADFTDHGCEA
ncbi:hypothetical protein GCM10015536_00980 [Streptomyces griseomycini]|nr:hypothetical protein GCM10015536_00980 [Streptomyces griseomycini]